MGLGGPGAAALLLAGLGGIPENGSLDGIHDGGQDINLVGSWRLSVIKSSLF